MTEEEDKLHARLEVLSFLLCGALLEIYRLKGWGKEQALAEHDRLRQFIAGHASPFMHPAESDAHSAMLEDELEAHLAALETLAGWRE